MVYVVIFFVKLLMTDFNALVLQLMSWDVQLYRTGNQLRRPSSRKPLWTNVGPQVGVGHWYSLSYVDRYLSLSTPSFIFLINFHGNMLIYLVVVGSGTTRPVMTMANSHTVVYCRQRHRSDQNKHHQRQQLLLAIHLRFNLGVATFPFRLLIFVNLSWCL